jgi:diadenosine tetraphosphatase ApaH/serine/threonine PP2A family protein phosphatase
MRIALFADIHANRQAFEACLRDAEARGVGRYLLLGDYVGYGADPVYAMDKVMEMVGRGALAVVGNHDVGVNDPSSRVNSEAQFVIDWTRSQLGVEERRFLAELPLTLSDGDRLLVHSDASAPAKWIYVLTVEEASKSLRSTKAQITFCGHTHKPAIFSVTTAAKMTAFSPVPDVPVPLHGLRRWLVVLGSVGQPRDGKPAASYAIFDDVKKEITFMRVPYDIEGAADAIRKARLPLFFAERLFMGR